MTDHTPAQPERRKPSSQPVLRRALTLGGAVSAVLVLLAAAVGFFIAGEQGMLSGALGALSAFVFFAITIVSILVSNSFVQSDFYVVLFFIGVLGSWLLKFVLFFVAAFALKDQEWVHPTIFFVSVLAGVLASLVVDVIVVATSRVATVGDLSADRDV